MAWKSHGSWKGVRKRKLLFWIFVFLVCVRMSSTENIVLSNRGVEDHVLDKDTVCLLEVNDVAPPNISTVHAEVKFEHPFLDPEKGLVPGLEYKMMVSVTSLSLTDRVLLTSQPRGVFGSTLLARQCNDSSSIIATLSKGKDLSVDFTLGYRIMEYESSNLTVAVFIKDETKWKRIHSQKFYVRTGCFHVRNETEGTMTDKDFIREKESCKQISWLVIFPETSYLEVQFHDVRIPQEVENNCISMQNVSEHVKGYNICSSIAKFSLQVYNGYFLITTSHCHQCQFQADFTSVASAFECNSTVRTAKGSVSRWFVSSEPTLEDKNCYTVIEGPLRYRVLAHFSTVSDHNYAQKNCDSFNFALDPVSGYKQPVVWSLCKNSSNHLSAYISRQNFLTLVWNRTLASLTGDGQRTFTFNYNFLMPCVNRVFYPSPSGSICSPGYPHVFLACAISYSIYVPLGYTVELSFSELELSGEEKSAFCNHNFLEIANREDDDGSIGRGKTLARLCGNWSSVDRELLTFRSSSNFLQVQTSEDTTDSFVRGFCAHFRAMPSNDNLTSNCDYGWISSNRFCYAIYGDTRNWTSAESNCQEEKGHLASVTDSTISDLIDQVIKTSPFYETQHAFWIGANDLTYENSYEWADGQVFNFENWFPGWENFGGYSAQPSDDGLSHQNCVEMRNVFRYPSKGEGVTDTFYWNDRDCSVKNPYICQRLKPGINLEQAPIPTCNRTITLTSEHNRDVIVSPNFPDHYPNNFECHYNISGPESNRIVLIFTDFHLEEGDSCEYDFLKIQTTPKGAEEWRRCGDWERKIKLLRYISETSNLHLTFVSDFSHSYKGFRVEIRLLSDRPSSSVLCDNERFELRDGQCYLMVTYPETSWQTAKQICLEARAQLATVDSPKELSILHDMIRVTYGYMSGMLFWVGATTKPGSFTWRWIDGGVLNPRKFHILRNEDSQASCLAIQWRQLRSNSALYWAAKNCSHPGRFICKKKAIMIPKNLNRTITANFANLTSVNYPSNYVNEIDYMVKIVGPPGSKVVVTFYHLDIEWQEECLYDYVLLRNELTDEGTRFCGDLDRVKEKFEFESATNVLYFSFHSDYSITASGFFASYEMVEYSSCSNHHIVTQDVVHVTSPRYPKGYLSGMDCKITLESTDPNHRLLLTIDDIDIFSDGRCGNDYVEILLDAGSESKSIQFCDNKIAAETQYLTYGNEALITFHTKQRTREKIRRRGFNITVESWEDTELKTTLFLKEFGFVSNLNFPQPTPDRLNYTQRLVVPLGHKINLRTPNITYWPSRPATSCSASGLVLWDPYGRVGNRTLWTPCLNLNNLIQGNGIWSTLHVLYLYSWSNDGSLPQFYIEYRIIKDDHFVNTTLAMSSLPEYVDSCLPNPCQHGGRCHYNGVTSQCHCYGQYTGIFCHLTWCDLNVCGDYGMCNLTSTGYHCECLNGFTGDKCQQTVTPCLPNPCEPNGQCTVENGTFACFCNIWYEGLRCEKYAYRIPYKPLSQRMLEEPFWLGLITVFTVLVIILFVYCIKRKFADKIEKFLAEEIERSKFQPSPPATRYSLSSTQPSLTPGSQSPQTNPKSLFNRIRKNSLLSSNCSPNATPEKDSSRTFSFDDILRRVHSSKRYSNTRGASSNGISFSGNGGATSSMNGDSGSFKQEPAMKEDEKSRILSSLVTSTKDPASRRMSLDEFFRMSERKMQLNSKKEGAGDGTTSEGSTKETSFTTILSPKISRYSTPSFAEIKSIKEQSMEYVSSSDSLNGEPNTSEVQADVLPNPTFFVTEYEDQGEEEESLSDQEPQSDTDRPSISAPYKTKTSPSSEIPIQLMTPPPLPPNIRTDSDTIEDDSEEHTCEDPTHVNTCSKCQSSNSNPQCQSSYLEVPHPIPSIQVFTVDHESSEVETPCTKTLTSPKVDRSAQSSPSKMNFVQPRKYSVDLPMPKILITANVNACDSDEASPPRTPNPVKSMMYLSPLAVISSSADRTISESNLSTSGYSSISSPGLSRCNSSSPISDDVEQQTQQHQNCSKKGDCHSPKKPVSHSLQMGQMTYLTVSAGDKAFYFPPTIACHCQEVITNPPPVILNTKNALPQTLWKCPAPRQVHEKNRPLIKRHSYQPTSTDDSIDDEGIGMDTIDFKIRKGELRSARELEMFFAANKHDREEPETVPSPPPPPIPDKLLSPPNNLLESNKPDLLTCSVNKSGTPNLFKGSPRSIIRKNEKGKKYVDKYRRSPNVSPATTPIKDLLEYPDGRIPHNTARTNMSGFMVSSSESDDPEGLVGLRPKNQARRPKRPNDNTGSSISGSKQHSSPSSPLPSAYPQEHTKIVEKISDATSRSESNGDSAPLDSRSPVSSSSESLPSTLDSALSNTVSNDIAQNVPPPVQITVPPLCNKHRLALEHASSFPLPKEIDQPHYHSSTNIKQALKDDTKQSMFKSQVRDFPLEETFTQPLLLKQHSAENGCERKNLHPPISRIGCGSAYIRSKPQSLNSLESSVPSDSEEEVIHFNNRSNDRFFRPLIRLPEEAQHPSLKRQEAITEDDVSDDSSSETTVLLQRPPTDENSSERSSPYQPLKENDSSQSADISEWETASLFPADSPKSPEPQKGDKNIGEK